MAAPSTAIGGATEAVLATMHGKQRVIVPLLGTALGLHIQLPATLDTDRFGSFSRDIPRAGTALDAARAKIAAAFECAPQASIVLASEGSFGPHPQIPFVPLDSEIVVLRDRRSGLEIVGRHSTARANFAHTVTSDLSAAINFAERIGFPAHGVIVIGTADGQPAPERLLRKTIETVPDLRRAVSEAISMCGAMHIETDMRAHRNPTRRRAIKWASVDLLGRYGSVCPPCARPGFVVTQRLASLPCAGCGRLTDMTRAEVLLCAGCAHRFERLVSPAVADPGRCDYCNP